MILTDTLADATTIAPTEWRSRVIAPAIGRDDLNAAVLDNMRDGVLTLDPTGRITTVNPALEEMLTVRADKMIGESFAAVMLQRSDLDEFNDVMLEAIYSPQRTINKTVIIDRLGRLRHFALRTNLLLNPQGGAPLGLVVVVSDETERVTALTRQREFGQILMQLIVTMTIGSLAMLTMFHYLDLRALAGSAQTIWVQISWLYLFLIGMPAAFFAWQSDIPIENFGLTTRNLRQSVVEGLAISSVATAALLSVSLGLRLASPEFAAEPLFKWHHFFSWIFVSYAVHSFVQELVARGVLQSVITRVLDDKQGYRSIFMASLVFAALHAHFGFTLVFISFFSGLLFGWLYHRHGNLVGATLVHLLGGSMVFALGFV